MDPPSRETPVRELPSHLSTLITTLTPNPSIDRTLAIGRLERGEVLRATTASVEFAGKGVNLARVLTTNGHQAQAVIPGNPDGLADLIAPLNEAGTQTHMVAIEGTVRTNLTIIEDDGTTTKINESGPRLSASAVDALLDTAVNQAADSQWLVASGSLPPGAPTDFYVQLAERLPDTPEKLVIDTSGPALARMAHTPCAVAKPNLEELASLTQKPLWTLGDVVDAASELQRHGWSTVLVSLGGSGAVLVDDQVSYGTSPASDIRNTVGAGDALLAGFLAGGAKGPTALHNALAWARAAVRSTDTVGPPCTDEDQSAVTMTTDVPLEMIVGHGSG